MKEKKLEEEDFVFNSKKSYKIYKISIYAIVLCNDNEFFKLEDKLGFPKSFISFISISFEHTKQVISINP
jgi:hypothetical protein